MEVLTTTPFGQRPVTAALIEQARAAQSPVSVGHFNKWELFRELCVARGPYGVTDRDLTVLNALLSFHQGNNLSDNDNLIVFPSNAALSERAHGMAESTLRRHIAALTDAGLIQRHDSPNGKRYATRGFDGEIARAFGFDLRPLLVHAEDITRQAAEIRQADARKKRLREEVTLIKRDALKLTIYGQEVAAKHDWTGIEAKLLTIHKELRRKLPLDMLSDIRRKLVDLLATIRAWLAIETDKMDGSDAETERHHQNSKPDSYVSELSQENGKGGQAGDTEGAGEADTLKQVNLPLPLVLKACPDILPYADGDIRHWHELIATAGFVRGMMGISPDAWQQAQTAMGAANAAITVACIMQRITDIQNPGGYLRALTRKAEDSAFSPGPMVMALLNGTNKVAV